MTEKQLRQKYVDTFKSFLGSKEGSTGHKKIIDTYNTYKPHPRGFKMTYSADWCAASVSSIALMCGIEKIFAFECSCNTQIRMWKEMGVWQENDAYKPQIGDIVYFDWDDRSGKADNRGEVEHVGAVAEVLGNVLRIIEGNKNNSVAYREITVNGKYIRGYAVPDYASVVDGKEEGKAEKPKTEKPASGFNALVQKWQKAAQRDGFTFPVYGADGLWGAECERVAQKAIIKKDGGHHYLNMFLQERLFSLGFNMKSSRKKNGTFDGIIGSGTIKAVKKLQKKAGFKSKDIDGEVGAKTWPLVLDL